MHFQPMKNILLPLLLMLAAGSTLAQQDPLYAQYYNNPMLINPAFAGSHERLYAGVAYRSQWTGIQGMPVTYNFNSHISLAQNRVGLGIYAVQDKLGDIQNTSYGAVYAYRIRLNDATTFSFGLQTGFTRYATDPESVNIKNNPDPRFTNFNETTFNTGAGLLLQNDNYRIGLSVPRLLTNSVNYAGADIKVYHQNLYLYGGYIFQLNEAIRFRPSALLRSTTKTKMAVDLNANLELNRKYIAGIFTRNFNSYGAIVQLIIGDLRAGYVYEVPGKKSALYYNTHEVSFSVSLSVLQGHAIMNGL